MRGVGYACGGLIAAGLTAFTVLDRAEPGPLASVSEPVSRTASAVADDSEPVGGSLRPTGSPDARDEARSTNRARSNGETGSVAHAPPVEGASSTGSDDASDDERRPGSRARQDRAPDRDDVRDDEARRDDDRDDRRRRWRRRYREPLPPPEAWEPPEGPVRIGLQAGHWRAHEAPPELSGLRGNGTRGGGLDEWEANLAIARRAGAMLEELGYVVDILPAVVPPEYRAHLFISIHSDGSNDPRASGFRVAAPRRDATHRASGMVELLEGTYARATGLPRLPQVTRRMRSYYAFNSRRYEHALHPMTIGVIIETGFLTSAGDRRVIVEDPDRPARGIVEAVKAFPVTPPPGVKAVVDGVESDGTGREG